MALQETNIPVSFAKGLNTKSDPKQVVQGSLLDISNGVFTKVNAINQDPGYTPIPQTIYNSTNTFSSGNSLTVFNGEMVGSDSQFLYTFSETTQSWVQAPTKVANSIITSPVGANAPGTTSIGVVRAANGIEMYAYGETIPGVSSSFPVTGIQLTLLDPVEETIFYTRALTLPNQSSILTVNNVSFGTKMSAIYYSNNSGNPFLASVTIDNLNPVTTLSSLTLLTFPSGSTSIPDVVQSPTNIYVLYTSGSNIILTEYNTTFSVVNTVFVSTVEGFVGAASIIRDPATGNLILSWAEANANVYAAVYSSTMAVISPRTTLAASSSGPASAVATTLIGSNIYTYFQAPSSNPGGTYYDTYMYTAVYPNLTASTFVEKIYNVYISSKPYEFNSQPTINVGFFDFSLVGGVELLEQSVYFTIQQAIPNPGSMANYKLNVPYTIMTKYSEGSAGAPPGPTGGIPPASPTQILSLSNTNVIIPYLDNSQVEIDSNKLENIYNVVRLSDTFGTHTRSVNLGNNLNLTGGTLSIFDGVGIAESGYNVFPSQTTAAFSTALVVGTPPPSLTFGDTYSYVVTYEWIDNYGNLHRSAPSIAATGVAATGDSSHISQATVVVNGTALSESYKINNISVVLWRTQGNGVIFFRIKVAPNVAGPITFVDSTPDSSILSSTQIYTTGGEVDNIAPPAADIIFPFKNRLIAIQSENPFVWWASKQVIQGFPVEFSDLFAFNIDMTGGPISAGSTMDDKLIFFKNSTIFYVIGDGPAPNGTNNDFSYPQVITSDVGCTNQDSIIVIPIGLMFQSTDKGIYLLDRTLQVQYIGAAVEQFNNILVTSAQLLPNTTQVRFTLATGTILIYDYLVSQWSTHTTLTFADSTIYKQQHTGLQANGQVLEQVQGQWIDISTPDALTLTTGWFDFAQLQGYQRVKEFLLLLTSVNATSILVEVFNDFDTTNAINSDLITIPADTIRQQYRIFPAFQKAQSMQVRITEIPTGSQAGGLLLSGMSFTVAVKRGLNKISADRSFG